MAPRRNAKSKVGKIRLDAHSQGQQNDVSRKRKKACWEKLKADNARTGILIYFNTAATNLAVAFSPDQGRKEDLGGEQDTKANSYWLRAAVSLVRAILEPGGQMIFFYAPVHSSACAQDQADLKKAICHSQACTLPGPRTRYQDGYR